MLSKRRYLVNKLLNSIKNYLFAPPILVNSIPKAGTNLLRKAVCTLPGVASSAKHIGESTTTSQSDTSDSVTVGIDKPVQVETNKFTQKIHSLSNASVATCHIPYSRTADEIINSKDISHLVIIRHPAEVALSHVNYILESPNHFAYKRYSELSKRECLELSILGSSEINLLSLRERFSRILDWLSYSDPFLVRFEDLIGKEGGGSRRRQLRTLRNIADNCRVRVEESELKKCARRIFGGTSTFQKGRGGQSRGWQDDIERGHFQILESQLGEISRRLGYDLNISDQ
jgi:hypothetical protein